MKLVKSGTSAILYISEGYSAYNNLEKGNYGRLLVNEIVVATGLATTSASAPVALTIGIIVGITDAIWGDDLGDYIQDNYFDE